MNNDKRDLQNSRTSLDAEKAILEMKHPVDYLRMNEYIDVFMRRYQFIETTSIGKTIMGRDIPVICLGSPEARRAVLYVGSHHGMEWITTAILLRFINEYCECLSNSRRMYNMNMSFLFENRRIYVVPMLNCDGVELQINGLCEENPMYDRLISMNSGSLDFSRWQANVRGVDLNHNYNAGFAEYKQLEAAADIFGGAPTRFSGEAPESEPETAALCNFIRYMEIRMIFALHTQGEEIFYTSGDVVSPRSLQIARLLSRMCGYKLAEPEGMAAYGGLTDWFIREFNKPSFTIECGKGENPLPVSDFFEIYSRLREMLFTSPILG